METRVQKVPQGGGSSPVVCRLNEHFPQQKDNSPYKDPGDYKYILTWTPDTENVKLMGWSYPHLDGFQKAGCAEYRCHLTNNRSYLG